MPPKKRAATPPSRKHVKKNKQAQVSIDTFFSSPTKPKSKVTRETSVIDIADSEDEVEDNKASDEKLARRLDQQWADEDRKSTKGKEKAKEEEVIALEDEEESPAVEERPMGVNGSSSSRSRTPKLSSPVKHEVSEDKKELLPTTPNKPLASIFAKPSPNTNNKPGIPQSPSKPKQEGPTTITSVSADSVDPIDFDVDQFLFRPAEVDTSKWPKGRLPYSVLVGVYVQVSSTRSRLLIVRVLTNFLHLLLHASPVDLTPSLYLLSNHLLPSYLPSELGIGSQILGKAIQEVSGAEPKDLRKLWHKWGDPGDVAFEAKSNLRTLVKPSPLLVGDVYTRLLGLIRIKGTQSGRLKGDVVRKLMVQARGEEVRFLVRSLVGNLRIGAVRLTLLTSLARATALFHLPRELAELVKPIPHPAPKEKGKRVIKPKVEPDSAREEVEEKCLEAVKLVRKVYVRHPNYGDLVKGLDAGGLVGLDERVRVSVGIPLSPMLGSITRSLNEVFTRLGTLPFTAEAKLDGQRVQIHARRYGPQGEDDGGGRWVSDGEDKVWVRLFSRHLEDMTEKYPDICQLALTLLNRSVPDRAPFPKTASPAPQRAIDQLHTAKLDSFVMDAEVVAVDKDTGAYRTFQDLSNRAKKDVKVEDIKVIVGIFAFDLMLLNDEPILDSPFSHRRHLLRTLFPPFANPADPTLARFSHVEAIDSTSCTDVPAEIQAFFEQVVEQKCEGLMVKLLESGEGITGEDDDDEDDAATTPRKKKGNGGGKKKPLPATYEPDQRSQGWLKVKKDYLEGLGDSLDLVPIGAWWGQGRKAGWWSPILLACHNPETGALEAVCKCISGFTDAFYKDLIVRYPPENAIPEKCNKDTPLGYYDTNGLRPDVWFLPSEVWEMRGADITLSPVYPAAATLLGSERGLSIRFPRFIKLREDKGWEEATTSEQFAEMYRRQCREAPARVEKVGPGVIRKLSEEAEGEGDEGEQGTAEAEGDGEDEEEALDGEVPGEGETELGVDRED